MIEHLINFFGKLTFTAWCFLLIPFILAAVAVIIKVYIKHPVIKWGSYFILLVFFFRIALFKNPVAWAAYNKILPADLIDWRHHDVIKTETGKYLKPQENLKYLAVGSSQTTVTYQKFAGLHDNFSIFSLAGLSPLDLYTYRQEIVRKKPEYILMFLSEFELARQPEISSSKWSPFSFRDIVELRNVMDTSGYFSAEDKQIIHDLFIGKYLTEYKYAFVFKDMLAIPFNKKELSHITTSDPKNDSISLAIHLKYLSELSEKYIPFNMFYFEKAVHFFNANKIPVIIVEGQYNPLAYQPHNLALNKKVRILLKEFLQNNPLNIYLTREETTLLVREDFRDGYHVKEEVGLKYAENLIKKLDSMVF